MGGVRAVWFSCVFRSAAQHCATEPSRFQAHLACPADERRMPTLLASGGQTMNSARARSLC